MYLSDQRKNTIVKKYLDEDKLNQIELAKADNAKMLNIIERVALTYVDEIKDAYISGMEGVYIRFEIPFFPNIYYADRIHFLCKGDVIDKRYQSYEAPLFQNLREFYGISLEEYKEKYEEMDKKDNDKRYEMLLNYNVETQLRKTIRETLGIRLERGAYPTSGYLCCVYSDLKCIEFFMVFDDSVIRNEIEIKYSQDDRLTSNEKKYMTEAVVKKTLDLRNNQKEIVSKQEYEKIKSKELKIKKKPVRDYTKESKLQIGGYCLCILMLLLLVSAVLSNN